jgi:threonylcarbamoyladenosine tRNA methylthiotransferase MtaB
MKRKYDTAAFLATLERIRAVRKDIAITTDVIVGFPGESEEEWQETLSFASKPVSRNPCFPVSPARRDLRRFTLDTPSPIKEKRVHELLELSKKLRSPTKNASMGKP